MKQQPDTSTMEGRHAVEKASETCRIQFQNRPSSEWSPCNDTPGSDRLFDWRRSSYRIHPDDLAKLPDPAAQPADEWRDLEVGERIEMSDYISVRDRLESVAPHWIGSEVPEDLKGYFRRRVTKPDEWRPWRIERIKNVLAQCREFKKNTRTAQSFDELELAVSMIVDYLNDLDGTPCGARKET